MSNEQKKQSDSNIMNEIKQWLMAFLICALVVIVVKAFIFNTFLVKGSSMEPNFHHSDIVLVSKMNYLFSDPEKTDIIVCKCDYGKGEENIIKRVIGMPGDVINFELSGSEYILSVNDIPLSENYIMEPIQQKGDMEYPYTVPEDTYFVMGDNRNASNDSRFKSVGAIPKKDIIGKVVMRFYPFNKISFY